MQKRFKKMHSMVGKFVKIIGFDDRGEMYPISKGTLVDFVEVADRGVVEVKLSHEGMLRIVKISSRMTIQESPG